MVESTTKNIVPAMSGMKALNFIDISDPDDPMIYIKGMYSIPYIAGRRDIVNRMREIATKVERGSMSVIDLSRLFGFMPPRYIGDETPTVIQAFAEAEILLQTPAVKAKLTRARAKRV